MKKIVFVLLLASTVFAGEKATWIGIGQGKENVSLEWGMRIDRFGVNVYSAGDYDYSEGEVIDYPPPHTNYIRENDRKVGQAHGIDFMYFPLSYKGFTPFVEAGITIQEYRDVAISQDTGDYGRIYSLSKQTKLELAGGIGLFYRYDLLNIGVELHSKKGIMGLVGISF